MIFAFRSPVLPPCKTNPKGCKGASLDFTGLPRQFAGNKGDFDAA
jgi:hypothetical protein